ncbi:ABC transporter permease [Streptococcus saliviloxodontae]|uniref:Osmoprotectant transport system permease protein n=1 Tax=Streptococcus saliviloxodontae TaxID=1349416 RepID=A0ABS2PL19_9STRE|nr:ABC transporter permease [Streptococcus saliviloxodontae]MBM7635680.1 osmoprotectant transport system permease protein [Streptococcus saliviloxodontae]
MIDYLQTSADKLISATLEHIILSGTALVIALLLAMVVSVLLWFNPYLRQVSVYVLSLLYAIPSFALFALLIPLTGLGTTTAIIVLVIYAQYILVRTFIAGLTQVDSSIVEAAMGMGMSKRQLLFKVELPLAQASLFSGLRLAATSIIAIATIASTINGGGLGVILFDGLRTLSMPKLIWGILLTIGLSILTNFIIYLIEELCRPEGK